MQRPAESRSEIGIERTASTGPVSSAASMRMMVTPVTVSPASSAR